MKSIIAIQHAQSIHHTNGMIGAWTDWDLTDFGKEQAENIGKALKQEIDYEKYVIYSSDLKRAKQTAELIGIQLNKTPVFRRELREVNVGVNTPTTGKEFNETKAPRAPDRYDPDYKPFPNAESDRDLWNRLYPFMQEMIRNDDENIILVSHGTALKFFFSMWVDDDFAAMEKNRFRGKAGGVSKLFVNSNGKRTIKLLNDISYMKNNMSTIVIEQTNHYPKRMKYDPVSKTFHAKDCDSLSYVRGCPYPSGWIKESGTPPQPHLDAILLSLEHYELGDEVPIKIVGCFVRSDGDHKLVGVLPERKETDLSELPQNEKETLRGLYPGINESEGWFGIETAKKIINDFYEL